jgi:hypothetical protein
MTGGNVLPVICQNLFLGRPPPKLVLSGLVGVPSPWQLGSVNDIAYTQMLLSILI